MKNRSVILFAAAAVIAVIAVVFTFANKPGTSPVIAPAPDTTPVSETTTAAPETTASSTTAPETTTTAAETTPVTTSAATTAPETTAAQETATVTPAVTKEETEPETKEATKAETKEGTSKETTKESDKPKTTTGSAATTGSGERTEGFITKEGTGTHSPIPSISVTESNKIQKELAECAVNGDIVGARKIAKEFMIKYYSDILPEESLNDWLNYFDNCEDPVMIFAKVQGLCCMANQVYESSANIKYDIVGLDNKKQEVKVGALAIGVKNKENTIIEV